MSKTILAIDDDPAVRSTVFDLLAAESFQVHLAENGAVGVEVARDLIPDLIVCDVRMPELDGYGVLQALRSHAPTADIPFIFLTGLDDRAEVRQGMVQGGDDYLTKPVDPVDLVEAVKAQLRKHEAQTSRRQEELNRLRQNIAYALPHELRTPLSAMMGYAELLHDEAMTANPEEVREWACTIIKGGKRLERVIENYLVYAQVEILLNDPEFNRKRPTHLTPDAAGLVNAAARDVAYTHQRDADLIAVTHDSADLNIAHTDLRKIMVELLDNAFKFSVKGTRVVVKTVPEDGWFQIFIQDHGRGMTAEDIAQIGAYMQFNRAVHEQQGIGLGFSIARQLTRLYRGRFKIASEPGKGTILSVSFPIVAAAS